MNWVIIILTTTPRGGGGEGTRISLFFTSKQFCADLFSEQYSCNVSFSTSGLKDEDLPLFFVFFYRNRLDILFFLSAYIHSRWCDPPTEDR